MSEHVTHRVARRASWRAWTVLGGLLLLLAHTLDHHAYHALAISKPTLSEWESHAWYRTIKSVGELPVWLIVGLILVVADRLRRVQRWWPRALAVPLGAACAGLTAELLKLILSRERPTRLIDGEFHFQGYVWHAPLSGFIDSANLGLPSSHAATAFGGAIALGLVLPRARYPAWALASLCAFSRVVASAHWLSDVVLGAIVGYALAMFVCSRLRLPTD